MIFTVPKTPYALRLVDYLMIPLMFILGGFKRDAIQETHPWHSWRNFSPDSIDRASTVSTSGSEKTFNQHFLFLFHAPIFGGWKKYTTYAPVQSVTTFHIGWIISRNGKQVEHAINTLPVSNGAIRTLDGSPSYKVTFFAVDENGRQIALRKVGEGTLGDNKYPGVRLF